MSFSRASLDCLCSFPAGRNRSYTTPVFFSNQKLRRHIETLAGKSNDYILSSKPRLTLVQYLCSLAIPSNSARNACWHFLEQSLGMVNPQQQRQKCLLAVLGAITRNEGAEPILATAPKGCHSRGIINTITEGSASARIYRCSISPGE